MNISEIAISIGSKIDSRRSSNKYTKHTAQFPNYRLHDLKLSQTKPQNSHDTKKKPLFPYTYRLLQLVDAVEIRQGDLYTSCHGLLSFTDPHSGTIMSHDR